MSSLNYFTTNNSRGYQLIALLLKTGHVGLAVAPASQTDGSVTLECFFPFLSSSSEAVIQQALLSLIPSSTKEHVRLEALLLLASVQQGNSATSAWQQHLEQNNTHLFNYNRWLCTGKGSPSLLTTEELTSFQTLMSAAQQTKELVTVPSPVTTTFSEEAPAVVPDHQLCNVCNTSISTSIQFIVIQHNSSECCYVHSTCLRQQGKCPVHPKTTVKKVFLFTRNFGWTSLSVSGLAPPCITEIQYPWLSAGWRQSTWDLLNSVCDSVLLPVTPLNRVAGSLLTVSTNFVQQSLNNLVGDHPQFNQFLPPPSQTGRNELQLVRACLYIISHLERVSVTSSVPVVVQLRSIAAYYLSQVRSINHCSRDRVQRLLNTGNDQLSPNVSSEITNRLLTVGEGLSVWEDLLKVIIQGCIKLSWSSIRQCLGKKNIELVKSKVLLHWKRVGLIEGEPAATTTMKTCDRCQEQVPLADANQLVSVGGNHWWCRNCRIIHHEILDSGEGHLSGVPSIGLTCYISCLLQMLVSSQTILDSFVPYQRENFLFSLPSTSLEADKMLLSSVAMSLLALSSTQSFVGPRMVVDIKQCLANSIQLDYYEFKEQPLSEVVRSVLQRLEETTDLPSSWINVDIYPLEELHERQFKIELLSAILGLENGFSTERTKTFIVERHTGSMEWDSLPNMLVLHGIVFLLRAFTVRTESNENNGSAHFISYRRQAGQWLRCDNHLVEELADVDVISKQADLIVYERRGVRIADREDGSPHPQGRSNVSKYGRKYKRTKRAIPAEGGIIFN